MNVIVNASEYNECVHKKDKYIFPIRMLRKCISKYTECFREYNESVHEYNHF